MDLFRANEINEGLRNLCLGRVLLKSDYVAATKTLPVGRQETSYAASLPGTGLFRRYTTAVTVVEPGATDTPGDIDHQEDATIADPVGRPLDLTTTAALTGAYTAAAGAYVRPKTLPAVCGTLRMIPNDFVEGATEPDDKFFPGVFVCWQGTEWAPLSQGEYNESLIFMVRYAMIGADAVNNRQALVNATAQLVNLIGESNDLGGNVDSAKVTRAVPFWSELGRNASRTNVRTTAQEHRILWSDIFVECWRGAAWDKVSTS